LKDCFVKKEKVEAAPGISILVKGREIVSFQAMAALLKAGDEIALLRFVSGG